MDTDKLISNIRPMSFDNDIPSHDEKNYFSYYGIDIENSIQNVKHYLGYINSNNFRIACHLFTRPEEKGSVYLLPGYFDHVGLYEYVIHFFLTEGYNVLAYDLPGHGISSGRPASIESFDLYRLILEDVIQHCKSMLPTPWLAYGQSTGCAILTEFMNHHTAQGITIPFKQVILSAPLVRPYLWNLSRIQLYLVRPFIKQMPRKFTNNCRNKSFLTKARNDPLAPTVLSIQWVTALDRWIRRIESSKEKIPLIPLILQGTDDRTVDGPHNVNVLTKLFLSTKVLWLEQARHHLPNELEHTREQYMHWISTHLG